MRIGQGTERLARSHSRPAAARRHARACSVQSDPWQFDSFGDLCEQQDVAAHGCDVAEVPLIPATLQIPRPDSHRRSLTHRSDKAPPIALVSTTADAAEWIGGDPPDGYPRRCVLPRPGAAGAAASVRNDTSSHLGLVPEYGEDAGPALDDALGRLQTHLAPRWPEGPI